MTSVVDPLELSNDGWRTGLRGYLGVSAIGHLLWEAAHVHLYTIWNTGTSIEITGAVLHCSVGDVLIAMSVLLVPLLTLPGGIIWPFPARRILPVVVATLTLRLAYTVASEWWNVEIRGTWSYTPEMPRLLPWGTGLTPVLQWLIVPSLALFAASSQAERAVHNATASRHGRPTRPANPERQSHDGVR